MRIPETPPEVSQLGLMKRLHAYAKGSETYFDNGDALSKHEQESCNRLYVNLLELCKHASSILDKVNTREMDIFTMHDSQHARKVAHIIWCILKDDERKKLTPPEIGLMVSTSFFHDIGMFLSPEQRDKCLSSDSELWETLEVEDDIKARILTLSEEAIVEKQSESGGSYSHAKIHQLHQAQEALLCRYVREIHASRNRYIALIEDVRAMHRDAPTRFPDIDACLSYDGDSFLQKMVDVCVSHNESASTLVSYQDIQNKEMRFSRSFPVGSCSVDLLKVACALRLADILDFDRERTPDVLYQYFLPRYTDVSEDRSKLEWQKHLAISHWYIEEKGIFFKGRCSNHIVHHAIVEFCKAISETILAAKDVCNFVAQGYWPFVLPTEVVAEIHSEGYTYLPYKFSLEDDKIYQLLMGAGIYNQPLDAIRELVQNAVDACKLRDALTEVNSTGAVLGIDDRISIQYLEPSESHDYPILKIIDSGTGMDQWIISNCFLRVGKSYYQTREFRKFRIKLRKADHDFAPVSQFGIGFLSCFLLGDRIQIDTAMWEPLHSGDIAHRRLEIYGMSRLIKVQEIQPKGMERLRGTHVAIHLLKGSPSSPNNPPTYDEISEYLRRVCHSIPYNLKLEHIAGDDLLEDASIEPQEVFPIIPSRFKDITLRIPVSDKDTGLTGEVIIADPEKWQYRKAELVSEEGCCTPSNLELKAEWEISEETELSSKLIRGGFLVGIVPGLPDWYSPGFVATAVLSLDWKNSQARSYLPTNLSRTGLPSEKTLANSVRRNWLSWMLDHTEELPEGFLASIAMGLGYVPKPTMYGWLQQYSAWDLFTLGVNGWSRQLRGRGFGSDDIAQWMKSCGRPLPLLGCDGYVYRFLLELVLPRVCSLALGSGFDGYFVLPPQLGWKDILLQCRDFIEKPVKWGSFAEYLEPIENMLLHATVDTNKLNNKYEESFRTIFNDEEIEQIRRVLTQLLSARQEHQIPLSRKSIELMILLQAEFGELEIGTAHDCWRIDSFDIKGDLN